MSIVSATNILTEKGFNYAGTCQICSTRWMKYVNATKRQYEVLLHPSGQKFKVKKNSAQLYYDVISLLTARLNALT